MEFFNSFDIFSLYSFLFFRWLFIIWFKFNNLKKFNSFYKKEYISTLSGYEYTPINKISLSSSNIFVRLSTNGIAKGKGLTAYSIVNTLSTHISSFNAGSSGQDIIYFKTDDQKHAGTPVNLIFFKNRNDIFSDSSVGYKNNNYTNNFTVTLSSLVGPTSAESLSNISITSTGIPGEGDSVDTFKISPSQYKGLESFLDPNYYKKVFIHKAVFFLSSP